MRDLTNKRNSKHRLFTISPPTIQNPSSQLLPAMRYREILNHHNLRWCTAESIVETVESRLMFSALKIPGALTSLKYYNHIIEILESD